MRTSEVVIKETKPLSPPNKIHMDRIITSLAGSSQQTEIAAETLNSCGPFLQRLLHAAQNTNTADRLDDIFQRVAAQFNFCANIKSTDNTDAFIIDIATKASHVLMEEESLLLSSGGDVNMSMSSTSQVVWSRVGQLVIQLVRNSNNNNNNNNNNNIGIITTNEHPSASSRRNSTSLSHSNLTGHDMNKTMENNINYDRPINIRASPLLLQRIPWKNECKDEKEESIEESPAMVSSFTVLWGSIFAFLQLLAKGSTERKSEKEEEQQQQLQGQHPLGNILADCVINMMEKNHSLLWEAHEMNQHGAAAEVLCVAANNFAWLLQQCKHLPMTNAVEIKEVLMQCTTDVLQDIVNGYSTELHYIFSLFLFPPRDVGHRQHVTPRILTGRLTAIRDICSSLAHVLPRSEVKSLLLERLLLPLTERLLDTKEHHHAVDKSSGNYQRSNRNYTISDDNPVEGFQTQPSVDGSPSTLAERVREMLDMLSSDNAFGRTICEESSSFCTISRLLPVMTS